MDDWAEIKARLAASGEAVFAVKVIPRSSRTEVVERLPDGAWKIKVAAVPEKGKANAALCAFLAGELGVGVSRVSVEAGTASTRKRVRVRV
jgi:hypothetical protein